MRPYEARLDALLPRFRVEVTDLKERICDRRRRGPAKSHATIEGADLAEAVAWTVGRPRVGRRPTAADGRACFRRSNGLNEPAFGWSPPAFVPVASGLTATTGQLGKVRTLSLGRRFSGCWTGKPTLRAQDHRQNQASETDARVPSDPSTSAGLYPGAHGFNLRRLRPTLLRSAAVPGSVGPRAVSGNVLLDGRSPLKPHGARNQLRLPPGEHAGTALPLRDEVIGQLPHHVPS